MTGRTRRGGRGSARCLGVVSGYLFKLIRESVGLTQAALAEELIVDQATVQGWESGRRSLTALRASDLSRLRQRMITLGALPSVFTVLRDALEADLIISAAVESGNELTATHLHPSATTVHRRELTNLITWPFTGITPAQLATLARSRTSLRRGPVPDHPALAGSEQTRFFDHLLALAERYREEENALLRRQAIYLLGFDRRPTSAEWLVVQHNEALRIASRVEHGPSWLAVRSAAIALAQSGDRDPLHSFVSSGLAHQKQQAAHLNYWAYWLGEIDDIYTDDWAMLNSDQDRWTGMRLFTHLLMRLTPGSSYAELNINSLWALLLLRPSVLTHSPDLRADALPKITTASDDASLTSRARQELASMAYAIRLAER